MRRRVHAVDAATGAREWVQRATADDAVADAGVVAASAVVVLLTASRAVGLAPGDGTVRWRHRLPSRLSDAGGRPSGAAADGRLFLPVSPTDEADAVVALDLDAGRELWRRRVGAVSGHLTVADSRVYVPAYDELRCLDAVDGSQRWRVAGDGKVTRYGTPVPAGSGLFVADGRRLVAYEERR